MSFKDWHFFSGINEISRGAGNVPVLVEVYLKKKTLGRTDFFTPRRAFLKYFPTYGF